MRGKREERCLFHVADHLGDGLRELVDVVEVHEALHFRTIHQQIHVKLGTCKRNRLKKGEKGYKGKKERPWRPPAAFADEVLY
jgi:hypothetical protein